MASDLQALKLADIKPGENTVLAKPQHEFFMNVPSPVVIEQVRHNIAMASHRGLLELDADIPPRAPGEDVISLCGSAPSLIKTTHEIVGKVMAFNAAIPTLTNLGIRVDYPMIWDASPDMDRYVCDIPGAEWMVASRVNPAVIDALLALSQKVTLWHTATDDPDMAEVLGPGRLQVFGGSQAVTRGAFLAGAMGYRDMHVFGADSSFDGDTHVGGSVRDEHEILCTVDDTGRLFRTTMWMLAQTESWVEFILPTLIGASVKVTVHGDGLLPFVHRLWMERRSADVEAA